MDGVVIKSLIADIYLDAFDKKFLCSKIIFCSKLVEYEKDRRQVRFEFPDKWNNTALPSSDGRAGEAAIPPALDRS